MVVKTVDDHKNAADALGKGTLRRAFSPSFDDDDAPSPMAGLTNAQYKAFLNSNSDLARATLGENAPGQKERTARERNETIKDYERVLLREKLRDQEKQLDDRINQLKEFTERLREKIAADRAFLDNNNLWLEEMRARHEGAAPAIRHFEENDYLERDENGEIKNKDAKRLLDSYLERARKDGKEVARPESDALAVQYMRDQIEWEQKNSLKTRTHLEKNEQILGKAQRLEDRLEVVKKSPSDSPAQRSKDLSVLEQETDVRFNELQRSLNENDETELAKALNNSKGEHRQERLQSENETYEDEGLPLGPVGLSGSFKNATHGVQATSTPAQATQQDLHEQNPARNISGP